MKPELTLREKRALQQAEALFVRALELAEPEARSRFVEESCQDNLLLQREVKSLLEAYQGAGTFLEPPVFAESPSPRLIEMEGPPPAVPRSRPAGPQRNGHAAHGQAEGPRQSGAGTERYLGIDLGAETIKMVELVRQGDRLAVRRRLLVEHHKEPGARLLEMLDELGQGEIRGAAVCGRLSRLVQLPQIPMKQAQARGYRFLLGDQPGTVLSIGSRGFSVLELREHGLHVFRENSRCSQGTGNFLRQLVERFELTPEEASEMCADVAKAAPLSGRCPVILKTDMTHLANKGEDRAAILAGLFDAVCENLMVLVKPGLSPSPVALIGGVSRSRRIRQTLGRLLAAQGMEVLGTSEEQAVFLEATGAALAASEHPAPAPAREAWLRPSAPCRLERIPALTQSLARVKRMAAAPRTGRNGHPLPLVLGLDIGSTGSKAVALDLESNTVVWEGYRRTLGDPVGAAQDLIRRFQEESGDAGYIRAFGVTGSGREIAGSLLATCYGGEAVFILNEIAAHARGAVHYDPRVDTIFEIGGQDAKYIRLAEGRVVDCAMNEACSAGTGSFIEEQGNKFEGIADVAHMGREALAAPYGVSLGQHCSVFMVEVIDEAVAAGVPPRTILAGLYDSIIQNYLNRVKGNRSVGQVVFCQGMPFASDALAAAVARQTGSDVIVPPNPGTVGALGIALLAAQELPWAERRPLDPHAFLQARLERKETFVCQSKVGCGGAGNRCRIDCIRTRVHEQRQTFTWGGGCSLHDQGTRKRKLPHLAPDPFRERQEWMQTLIGPYLERGDGPPLTLTGDFTLNGLLPFFAAFLAEAGCRVTLQAGGDLAALKRGIQSASVPFCAPMQLFHGVASRMAEETRGRLFFPMLRSLAPQGSEPVSRTCPILQAGPDVVRLDLGKAVEDRLVSPVMDLGAGGLRSKEFLESCARLAAELGMSQARWQAAYEVALALQAQFESRSQEIGRRALDYGREHDLPVVVVLGRAYTLYNRVLNSNVPSLLREQGAIAIPVDCYPVPSSVPTYRGMYWAYGQRILRAAEQVRRSKGVYSVYCTNYSCGPDSFNLHFYSYIMEGKPYAVIETDGHSGDAGTKTRVEAFLHCVNLDQQQATPAQRGNDFTRVQLQPQSAREIREHGGTLLIPDLGPGTEAVAACFRGAGFQAEALPPPDREALRLGRRYTSGKECLPLCLTLGSILQRILKDASGRQPFTLFMTGGEGPCRFGVYNLLNRITFERLGISERVRIWSPSDSAFFEAMPRGLDMLLFSALIASDLLRAGLLEARPGELQPGRAQAVYQRHAHALVRLLEEEARRTNSLSRGLWQVWRGGLFGLPALLESAMAELAALRHPEPRPTVLLVGEIYVRCVASANDGIIERLEERGLKVRLAPVDEYVEYADHVAWQTATRHPWSSRLARRVQTKIRDRFYDTAARALGWGQRVSVQDTIAAAQPYLREALRGEAVLTIGGPVEEWRHGRIDGALNVGPLECMPSKIAEAQLYHAAQREGLLSLSLPFNGEPADADKLDNFAFEVWARFRQRHGAGESATVPGSTAGLMVSNLGLVSPYAKASEDQ